MVSGIFVLLAISIYAISLAPVTWVLISEIFPNKIRGAASSVAIVSLMGGLFYTGFHLPYPGKKTGYLWAVLPVRGHLFPGLFVCVA
jgi:SP family xylose:H+ symportor-like MFS transporter